jgi:hypothetical protein
VCLCGGGKGRIVSFHQHSVNRIAWSTLQPAGVVDVAFDAGGFTRVADVRHTVQFTSHERRVHASTTHPLACTNRFEMQGPGSHFVLHF